ncbi:baculovirus repeated ORF a [Orgyia leucostigma nucleopolyhedrovirus]|uniref:Baculovirus repeated ORF a n=1 Tax=Orgyia leucostigma nucleopolyhedrovirus TaxID=490711 RepID=B0FDP1_9ABAC|nr:baculovirus repeated ORF a [Orgyia leucostigma nucleopolyhedrovirus]ABY65749.1 baculovirus repeated ORF a [Orgyia leucostigma nucleopolyhedrovirus]
MNMLQRFEFPLLQNKRDANFECWAAVLPSGCVVCKLQELAEFLNFDSEQSALEHVPKEWAPTWKQLQRKVKHDPAIVDWCDATRFVLAPGIYALLAHCFKPLERENAKHVREMILPAIRETGEFQINATNCVQTLRAQLLEARAEKQAILADYEEALSNYKSTLLAMDARVGEVEQHLKRRIAEPKPFTNETHMLIME